jgi:hypothetical protein
MGLSSLSRNRSKVSFNVLSLANEGIKATLLLSNTISLEGSCCNSRLTLWSLKLFSLYLEFLEILPDHSM